MKKKPILVYLPLSVFESGVLRVLKSTDILGTLSFYNRNIMKQLPVFWE